MVQVRLCLASQAVPTESGYPEDFICAIKRDLQAETAITLQTLEAAVEATLKSLTR